MIKKTLYRYEREGGGVTVSPDKPDCKYMERIRLISDEGKLLTFDGVNFCVVIDIDDPDGWYEVDDPFFAPEIVNETF